MTIMEGATTSENTESTASEADMSADPVVVDTSTITDPVADAAKAAADKGVTDDTKTDANGVANDTPAETPGEYVPNFKYNTMNEKGERVEAEIPKEFQDFIKTKEQEEMFRDVWTKAEGLEFIKPRFLKTREENQQLRQTLDTQLAPLQSELRGLGQSIEARDFSTVFEKLKMSKMDIYKWVDDQLKYDNMPLEQRQEIDRQRQAQARAQEAETSSQRYASELQNHAFELRKLQLDTTLATGHIAAAAQKFDAQYGEGAFRTQVIRQGQLAAMSKQDLPVTEAVKRVVQMFRLDQMPAAQAAPASAPVAQPQAPRAANNAAAAPKSAPVIPHVSGRGGAPAAKAITSIDQLRDLAKQKANS